MKRAAATAGVAAAGLTLIIIVPMMFFIGGDTGGTTPDCSTPSVSVGNTAPGIDTAAAAAAAAGWTGDDLVTAVAVAGAESGYNPLAENPDSTAKGLWQIMMSFHAPKFQGDDWRDPAANARVAHQLWLESGWQPWVAHTSGAYRKHLEEAAAAVARVTPDGFTPVSYGTVGCGTDTQTVAAGTVVWPVDKTTDRRNYGNSGSSWARGHTGTDFSIGCGTPVRAAHGGTIVIDTTQAWAGPWLVKVTTGPAALTTWYAHMQKVTVRAGETVAGGQIIGEVGTEGNSTGCHLHFEVHPRNGSIYADGIDPSPWLDQHAGTAVTPIVAAPTGGQLRVLTANVPFTLGDAAYAARVRALLATGPDVLLLQEAVHQDLTRITSTAPGRWGVFQGARGNERASVVIYDASKYTATGGQVLGFRGPRYDRWITWAALTSADTRVAVASVHMPIKADDTPTRARYRAMNTAIKTMRTRLEQAGYPVIFGGDWNAPLDRRRAQVEPVSFLASIGMTTNWRYGKACAGGTRYTGGVLDGFGFNPARIKPIGHGCYDRGPSDHRPVWMTARVA